MAHIRNLRNSVVIIPAPHAGEDVITLHPRGDLSGADAVMVDDATMEVVSVKNALARGYIEEISDEDVDQIRLRSAQAAEEETTERASQAAVEVRKDDSMTGVACVGPGVRPGLPCEGMLLRLSKEVRGGETPPLCKAHESLAHEYTYVEVQEEDPNTGEMRQVGKWRRMSMSTGPITTTL